MIIKNNAFRKMSCILGNTNYVSEVHKAEDIVRLLADVPKKFRLELILFVVDFLNGVRMVSPNTEEIRATYMVSYDALNSARASDYIFEFLTKVYAAFDNGSLKDVAMTISQYESNASSFVCRVAIFMEVFSDLKVCIVAQKG